MCKGRNNTDYSKLKQQLTLLLQSDEQCEEAYIFKAESKQLDEALRRAAKSRKCKGDDNLAATLQKMRSAPRRQFQGGAAKKVDNRIKKRDEQELVQRTGVEAMY
jgi:hypothetical protein